ncbi:TrmB family transcriptional regulator [Methanolobus chelungpuianus]|uniref:Transcriptional regulator n=1 Tax=Methanolobus chelungpuianus TaxID=502115 RepID=A0AAE3KXA5_9EURY|nr:TrmB family transcriptional regulator [Methanolobus chelungpuianus]MCQ6962029.1 transcriptional regulator [Methanolobus chelungpuianus]
MATLFDSLRNLGLTAYEAKVLVALTKKGSSTVADVHELSGIPRSAVYGALKKLEDKGIVEIHNTKPLKYKCVPPEDAIERLKQDFTIESSNALRQLEDIYRSAAAGDKEEGTWTINGYRHVTEKMIQLLSSTKEELFLTAPHPFYRKIPGATSRLAEKKQCMMLGILSEKISSGVKVRLISYDHEKAFFISEALPGAHVRLYARKEGELPSKGGVMVVDSREVLIDIKEAAGNKEDLTALWSDGKELVTIFRHLLEVEWESSEEINAFPSD